MGTVASVCSGADAGWMVGTTAHREAQCPPYTLRLSSFQKFPPFFHQTPKGYIRCPFYSWGTELRLIKGHAQGHPAN